MPEETPSERPGDSGADEPLLADLPGAARKLKDKLHSLGALDSAIRQEILNGDNAAAQQLSRIARMHAVDALGVMLECVALPVAERSRFSVNAIRQAEQFLEIEPDTFASFFAVDIEPDNRERKKALRELLVEVRDSIQDAPVDAMSPTRPLFWVPAVLRIGSAVLVATVVGAPLAALAVGESVVVEVTKAGITVTACAIAAELTNRVLERWLTPPGPAEPIASYNSHDHPRPPHEPNDDGVHDLNSRTPDELVTEGPASPAFDEPSVLLSEDLVVKSPDWLDLNDLSPSVLDELLLEDLEQPTVDDLAERQVELFEPVDEEGLQPDPPAPVDLDEPLRSKIDDPYDDFDL